jgi:hypothetical protein
MMARTGKRDQLVWQILEQPATIDLQYRSLFGRFAALRMPIQPSGAGGGQLRRGASANMDVEVQRVSRQDAPGNVVEVRERTPVG